MPRRGVAGALAATGIALTLCPRAFLPPAAQTRRVQVADRSLQSAEGPATSLVGPETTEAAAAKVAVENAYVAYGAAAVLAGAYVGLQRQTTVSPARPRVARRAQVEGADVNYLVLLSKGDLPKRIATVILLLALARVGFYIPLYGFDAEAVSEFFSRQGAQGTVGFIDQLFGGGLGRVSLFALGIGPYITSSIVFQILTQVTPSLKALAQGEEGEAGRDKYKNYIKQVAFAFAIFQGFGQSTQLQPFVFDSGPIWTLQITLQLAAGAMIILFLGDKMTEQKLGQGPSLLVFSSIVANLPTSVGKTMAKAADPESGQFAGGLFVASLVVTILGLVYILGAERRIPILFAKRLQDEASGQGGSEDAGQSYLPIKLNASGVLPLIFAGSLLSLPALAANYAKNPWLQGVAKNLLPGSDLYIPLSVVLIALFSYVSTFQVLDPKDMASVLRKQAAAIPQVRPGKETEEYLFQVLSRNSLFGAGILAFLFVLPNIIEAATKLSTPNSFGGTSLLILVGVAAETWRTLQAELLMQQYATDVDSFYKGKR